MRSANGNGTGCYPPSILAAKRHYPMPMTGYIDPALIGAKMKAARFKQFGGPEVLQGHVREKFVLSVG